MQFSLMEQRKVHNYSSLFVSPVICPRSIHDFALRGFYTHNKNPSQLHQDCISTGGCLLAEELSHPCIAKVNN